MTYYQELINHIDRSRRAHPRSTVVMDAGSFKVLAHGRNLTKLTAKLRRAKTKHGVPVVFRLPEKKVVWILRNRPLP